MKIIVIIILTWWFYVSIYRILLYTVGQDSSVGIPTRYGLDGPGIESQWGSGFSVTVQAGPKARPASCTVDTGSFPGIKRLERGVNHPPPFSAEVKERLEVYFTPPLCLHDRL
jgi:hypothetical protein